jgi:cob(I)alamin adenosyltransferase
MTRIYTRSGDNGTTGLIGGERVSKSSCRIEAYGTVDELNSFIGLAISHGIDEGILPALRRIQNELFEVGAELAQENDPANYRITASQVDGMEYEIDIITNRLAPLDQFILPGGSIASSYLHVARTICRRAERCVVTLHEQEGVNQDLIHYLNRLSDLLFVLARYQNSCENISDSTWIPKNN